MKRFYLLFPIIAMFAAGCEQNPDSSEPSSSFKLSGQVKEYTFKGIHNDSAFGRIVHSQSTYAYIYDGDGRILKETAIDYVGNAGENGWELQPTEERVFEYVYSANTADIKQNGTDYGKVTFDGQGRVVKEENGARGGTNTTTFTYNGNNIATCEIVSASGTSTFYEYTWQNGDVSQIKVGVKGSDAAEIFKFSYSDKENPFKDILDVAYFFLAPGYIYLPAGMAGAKNAHQLISETEPYPTTYEFTSNDNGQITRMSYPTDMGEVVLEITYYE